MFGEKKSKEILREVKWRIFGKAKYGNFWQKTDENWYSDIHESNYFLHENFKQFLKERKNNIKIVLEVELYPLPVNQLNYILDYSIGL